MTQTLDTATQDVLGVKEDQKPSQELGIPSSMDNQPAARVSGSTAILTEAWRPSCDLLGRSLSRLNRSFSPESADGSDLTAGANSSERRTFPRRDAHVPVSVVRIETDEAALGLESERLLDLRGVTGELLDLSRNGLAVVHQEPLATGERMVVRLCGDDPRSQRDQLATVVRVVEIADGRWKIVAQFAAPLEFEVAYDLFDRCEFLSE